MVAKLELNMAFLVFTRHIYSLMKLAIHYFSFKVEPFYTLPYCGFVSSMFYFYFQIKSNNHCKSKA